MDDTPLLAFRVEDGRLLSTVQLFNADNELLVQILDNELVLSTAPWDIELEGQTLTVRAGPGDIFVRLTFEPPSRLLIDRAQIFRNGIGIDVTPDKVALRNGVALSGNRAENRVLGVALGDRPAAAAFAMPSTRDSFAKHPEVEQRVVSFQALWPPGASPSK